MTPDLIPNLGETPPPGARRDAVHIAVIPAIAGTLLKPGQHVHVVDGKAFPASVGGVGVVNPFIFGEVLAGSSFWLLLYPGSITSLRHEWTHPAFPLHEEMTEDLAGRAASEEWLREFARSLAGDYNKMIAGAVSGAGCAFGEEYYGEITDEFWHHVEVVTGKKFGSLHRQDTHFRCAC